jgi:hypothetical protein
MAISESRMYSDVWRFPENRLGHSRASSWRPSLEIEIPGLLWLRILAEKLLHFVCTKSDHEDGHQSWEDIQLQQLFFRA